MHKIIKTIFIITILTTLIYSDPPVFYISPGLQLMYDFNTISFGVKMSLGGVFDNNICNVTAGMLGGKRREYYIEFQDIPLSFYGGNLGTVLTGFGIGISNIKMGNNFNNIQPRLSLFAGYFFFINATYTFITSKVNLSKLQLGSTLVCPIPTNLKLDYKL
jgi:hypothetical protein